MGTFDRDQIFIVNENGDKSELIRANVQSNKIYVHRSDIIIEDGDKIHRVLDGRKDEVYVVTSAGFRQRTAGIAAHYQCEVKKESELMREAQRAGNVVNTYNIHGDNNRLNYQSSDNSTNTLSLTNGADIESALRYLVEAKREAEKLSLPPDTHDTLTAVKEQLESKSPSKHVMEILLKSLPDVAKAIPAIGTLSTLISNIWK